MTDRIAIKRLTASDLTFFEHQFRTFDVGKQKAINLNANVFIGSLYPDLPTLAAEKDGKLGLDLFLYGPGMAPECNLQRKILKHGTYKNWRLDGEYVPNPPDQPGRFDALVPGDLLAIAFEGARIPEMARAVFLSSSDAADAETHRALDSFLGTRRMAPISYLELNEQIVKAGPPDEHPIWELLLDEALEDAALGGSEGRRFLSGRRSGNRVSPAELRRARARAEEIGRIGEELVRDELDRRMAAGEIQGFKWEAAENVTAPYDFEMVLASGAKCRIEVKTTAGPFQRRFHISTGELTVMSEDDPPCHLYRVYDADQDGATLRIAEDTRTFAMAILNSFAGLPAGVGVDSVSADPGILQFDDEFAIAAAPGEDD